MLMETDSSIYVLNNWKQSWCKKWTEEADILIKLAIGIYRSNSEERNKQENLGQLQDTRSKVVPVALTYSPDLKLSLLTGTAVIYC